MCVVPFLHPTSQSSLTAFSSAVVPQLSRYFYKTQLVPPPHRPVTLALRSTIIAAVVILETISNINEKIKFSHEDIRGSGAITTTSTRAPVVSFTQRPFYPRRKSPQHPLDRGLGDHQVDLDAVVNSKNSAPAGNETQLSS